MILDEFTKEYIVEQRLFPYIPFYIARYERELETKTDDAKFVHIEQAIRDLVYFRDELIRLHKEEEISDYELVDLMSLVNTIIKHITNGNENEGKLVEIMGGVVIELESERFEREVLKKVREQGIAQGIEQLMQQGIEQGIEQGMQQGIEKGRADEIFSSVQAGDYSMERGAEKLKISVFDFERQMQERGFKRPL